MVHLVQVVQLRLMVYISFSGLTGDGDTATCTYKADDGNGGVVTQTVHVFIEPVNDAPGDHRTG